MAGPNRGEEATKRLPHRPTAYDVVSPMSVPEMAASQTMTTRPKPTSGAYAPARNMIKTPGKTTPSPIVASTRAATKTIGMPNAS
jgi:hypothetical protein